ncbi:MAG: hypothetical protein ABW116_02270 [Candidatus Sedimenticola sp. 20ELBAFRAG]
MDIPADNHIEERIRICQEKVERYSEPQTSHEGVMLRLNRKLLADLMRLKENGRLDFNQQY